MCTSFIFLAAYVGTDVGTVLLVASIFSDLIFVLDVFRKFRTGLVSLHGR